MSLVTLVSGGLDSTLMALMTKESDIPQHPLFINYGQRAAEREYAACRAALAALGLPEPQAVDIAGFGKLIHSGLTDTSLDIVDNAFTPGRNLLFLLFGAAYAYTKDAAGVAIGLLNESSSLFPDQTSSFLTSAEFAINGALGRRLQIVAPLMSFSKQDVVQLAQAKGLRHTYSCHTGAPEPCGECIACREFQL